MAATTQDDFTQLLAATQTESGRTLLDLVQTSPVLLIFLRHFGCSFCRQAISDVSGIRTELADRNVQPVFVHLGTPERAKPYFDYYDLSSVERISDPDAALYQNPAFALRRVHPAWSLISPTVWYGWLRGALFRHGIGTIQEDGHQMPGLFFLKGPAIARSFRYRTIADQPDYLKLVA